MSATTRLAATPGAPRLPLSRLWLLIVLPPSLWAVQLIANVIMSMSICRHGSAWAARTAVLVTGVAMLAAEIALFAGGVRAFRRVSRGVSEPSEGLDQQVYMAVCAIFVAGLSIVAVLWSTLPAAWLADVCEGWR